MATRAARCCGRWRLMREARRPRPLTCRGNEQSLHTVVGVLMATVSSRQSWSIQKKRRSLGWSSCPIVLCNRPLYTSGAGHNLIVCAYTTQHRKQLDKSSAPNDEVTHPALCFQPASLLFGVTDKRRGSCEASPSQYPIVLSPARSPGSALRRAAAARPPPPSPPLITPPGADSSPSTAAAPPPLPTAAAASITGRPSAPASRRRPSPPRPRRPGLCATSAAAPPTRASHQTQTSRSPHPPCRATQVSLTSTASS